MWGLLVESRPVRGRMEVFLYLSKTLLLQTSKDNSNPTLRRILDYETDNAGFLLEIFDVRPAYKRNFSYPYFQ